MTIREWIVEKGDIFYYWILSRQLSHVESVLDVGCGACSPLRKIPKTFHSVGIDIFQESITRSKSMHIHDAYIRSDVTKIHKIFRRKSFDAVIALDLIEHLTKKDGEKLLVAMEAIARKKVIVMTPNGFYKQEPYEGNKYQIHKSGWSVEDFRSRGFAVYGIRGVQWIRGEYATIRLKPWFLWGLIATLSEQLTMFFPNIAYQLFAVKNL